MNSILQCLSATDSLTCVVIDRENRLLEKGKSKGIVQGNTIEYLLQCSSAMHYNYSLVDFFCVYV